MGTYNTLQASVTCPHCNTTVDAEIDAYFGNTLQMERLAIGDRYPWRLDRDAEHGGRPAEGNLDGDGYTVCPRCRRDFFVKVAVRADQIEGVQPDLERPAYIQSAKDIEEVAKVEGTQPSNQPWDPVAYAQSMRKSTFPVSAFFLIDAWEAIPRCIQWLRLLKAYNMPDMESSKYFDDVRDIYRSGQKVMNVDHNFPLVWDGQELPGLLRCHYFDQGRYEIELWLPGVIANDLADDFKDGHSGFWCGFMPPAFYD